MQNGCTSDHSASSQSSNLKSDNDDSEPIVLCLTKKFQVAYHYEQTCSALWVVVIRLYEVDILSGTLLTRGEFGILCGIGWTLNKEQNTEAPRFGSDFDD